MAGTYKIVIADLPQLSDRQAAIAIAPQTDVECDEVTKRIYEIAGLIRARNLAAGRHRADSPPPTARKLAACPPATNAAFEEACRRRARPA